MVKRIPEGGGQRIARCGKDDIRNLMAFIDSEWSRGHILGNDFKVMHWHYYNERRDDYNFIIAKTNGGGIQGLLGYIPNDRYDLAISEPFLFTALWLVKPGSGDRALGLKLLYALIDSEKTKNIATVGINQQAAGIYNMLKFETGVLDHFYIANPALAEYHLLENFKPDAAGSKPVRAGKAELSDVPETDFRYYFSKIQGDPQPFLPEKTSDYFICKYFRNPFYSYKVFGLFLNDEARAMFIYRAASSDGHTALRVAEMTGSLSGLPDMRPELIGLLNRYGAEYIDMYCHGVPASDLINLGFTAHSAADDIIIPNYFEPFIRKNVALGYACHPLVAARAGFRIFKGDGDQERPNLVRD